MTEIPVYGPTMQHDSDLFVMMLPIRKSTAGRFSAEAVETTVHLLLADALPEGIEIDPNRPIEKQWIGEYIPTEGREERILVRMSAFTRRVINGSE